MPSVTHLVRSKAWVQSHMAWSSIPAPQHSSSLFLWFQALESLVAVRGYESGFLEFKVSGVEMLWLMIKLGWGHGKKWLQCRRQME